MIALISEYAILLYVPRKDHRRNDCFGYWLNAKTGMNTIFYVLLKLRQKNVLIQSKKYLYSSGGWNLATPMFRNVPRPERVITWTLVYMAHSHLSHSPMKYSHRYQKGPSPMKTASFSPGKKQTKNVESKSRRKIGSTHVQHIRTRGAGQGGVAG